MKTIIYQGVEGSFGHITATEKFGDNCCYKAAETFREAFKLLSQKEGEIAVVPIENTLAGSIYENYDLLNQYNHWIIGERLTKIEHCLLVLPSVKNMKQINKIYSHPKALEQCSEFIQRHLWIKTVEHSNTAAAAAEIAATGDSSLAAIGSRRAADLYGLKILHENIEDDPKNTTRFIMISREAEIPPAADKCSFMIYLNHTPGALVRALQKLNHSNINLTKIESRPLRGHPFEYLFYLDLEFPQGESAKVQDNLCFLATEVPLLKILGFYQRGVQ